MKKTAKFSIFHGLALKLIRGWLAKRFTLTLDIRNVSVVFSVVLTQWLNGVTSFIPKTNGLHIILVEFDEVAIEKVKEALVKVQGSCLMKNGEDHYLSLKRLKEGKPFEIVYER